MDNSTDNGVLGLMTGPEVGELLRRLPDAESFKSEVIQRWTTTDSLGPVLVTFQRRHYRSGKLDLWFWAAVRAEQGNG